MRSSDGERALETHLKWLGITGWLREVEFAPDRKWRFDFFFPVQGLAIEVEGGSWSSGRHTRGSGFAEDCVKYNRATEMGIRVLRFTTEMVMDQTAVETIGRVLACSAV